MTVLQPRCTELLANDNLRITPHQLQHGPRIPIAEIGERCESIPC